MRPCLKENNNCKPNNPELPIREGAQGCFQDARSEKSQPRKIFHLRTWMTNNSHTKMLRKKRRALAHEDCQEQECTQKLCSGQRASIAERQALQDAPCSPLPTRACGLVSSRHCHWLLSYMLHFWLCHEPRASLSFHVKHLVELHYEFRCLQWDPTI